MLRYLGYAGQPMTPELDARIDEVVAHCLVVARPRGIHRTFAVAGHHTEDDGTPVVELEGTALTLRGHSMEEHMDGAVAVGVMAVTIGMGVERELQRLSLIDSLDQVIFDAAATTTVERAADACEANIVTEAAECGLYTNFRFSPGYGDMPMSTQPVLLATLDASRRLGITLSSTNYMTPTKSVTAVVGMFEQPQLSSRTACDACACHDFCSLRAAGTPCWSRADA